MNVPLNSYEQRLHNDIVLSLESALAMMKRDPTSMSELAAQVVNVRTQCQQAAMWASELFGALSN